MTSWPDFAELTVHIVVPDVAAAVQFYAAAFGASELYRNKEASGDRVVYSELLVAGARMIMHEEFPEFDLLAPNQLGGTPVSLRLNVADVDRTFMRAIDAGAKEIAPPELHFWGARSGALLDPFGHRWIISTQVHDPSPDDILRMGDASPKEARLSAAYPTGKVTPRQPRGG